MWAKNFRQQKSNFARTENYISEKKIDTYYNVFRSALKVSNLKHLKPHYSPRCPNEIVR